MSSFSNHPTASARNCSMARQIVEILIRYGADPTIKNHRGLQPADYTHDEELRQQLTRR